MEVEQLLGKLDEARFTQLVRLGQNITDFGQDEVIYRNARAYLVCILFASVLTALRMPMRKKPSTKKLEWRLSLTRKTMKKRFVGSYISTPAEISRFVVHLLLC